MAARLAADVMGVPTLLVARTDANSAGLLLSDIDRARRAVPHRRAGPAKASSNSAAGWTRPSRAGWPMRRMPTCCGARPPSRIWRRRARFAEAIHRQFPGKLLAYNCSPSFHWKRKLDDATIAGFQRELGAMGYKFQFVTLAGFHALNLSMFELARDYAASGMAAYSKLQEREFALAGEGYGAIKHQTLRGDRLLRRIGADHRRGAVVGGGAEGIDRRGAVPLRRAERVRHRDDARLRDGELLRNSTRSKERGPVGPPGWGVETTGRGGAEPRSNARGEHYKQRLLRAFSVSPRLRVECLAGSRRR